ncbi:MAG: hypothetical protein C4297_04810 [Gemmataceae bacterium]
MSVERIKAMRILLAAVLVLVTGGHGLAHALVVRCDMAQGKLHAVVTYEDGTPAARAIVRLSDMDNRPLVESRTDTQGRCFLGEFPAGEYLLIVDAGAGHRIRKKLRLPLAETQTSLGERHKHHADNELPWIKILIGLVAIGLFFATWYVVLRRRSGNGSRSAQDTYHADTATDTGRT